MRRRFLSTILICCIALLFLGGVQGNVPGDVEETIVEFVVIDTAYVATNCARLARGAVEASCAAGTTRFRPTDTWEITRISVTTTIAWTTTEGCTLDVDIDTATTATFNLGVTGLAAVGDRATTTALAVTTLAPGSYLIARHDDPAGSACADGAGCDCDGVNAGHNIRVYGIRR